jgi:hypothetical protein
MDLSSSLHPLLPEHLGVLAIGCLCADAPARPPAVRDLLAQHFGVSLSAERIAVVIERVKAQWPQLLGSHTGPESVLQPRSTQHAALVFTQTVPSHWHGNCVLDGGLLIRVATLPTVCFTLAFGMCRGEVLLLRCVDCGACYAGPWCWPTGGDSKNFPEGHHHPKGVTNLERLENSRWFFATPRVCWETALLRLFLLLAARGGVSWTALFVVYNSLFGSTLAGTQYAHREHFVKFVEMAVMVWGALRLICGARVDSLWAVQQHLRPHHVADDFRDLLAATRRAWERLAALHTCWLCRKWPGVIVDGKWCVQVSLCNYRPCGAVWCEALATGAVIGCTNRPQRGSKYCAAHLLPKGSREVAAPELVEHRVVISDHDASLEYKCRDGQWLSSSGAPAASIRAYELTLLPKMHPARPDDEPETCSKDPLRGTLESYVSRKSGGLLVGVSPCLQVVGVRPMYSSESLTQVILFVWHMLTYLTCTTWVIYDFACGALRHIRTQMDKRRGRPSESSWRRLLSLNWAVDRLHFGKGHVACKDEASTYYEPCVNPFSHSELLGIDTEAAEQIFHIANRWQTNLSHCHPVHFDLQLLLLSSEHNERNRCDKAVQRYKLKQSAGVSSEVASKSRAPGQDAGPCAESIHLKRRKLISHGCSEFESGSQAEACMVEGVPAQPPGSSTDMAPGLAAGVGRDFLACEFVYMNGGSRTVHKVVAHGGIWIATKCSYVPPWGAKPMRLQQLTGKDLYTCGTCCGARCPLILD